MASGAWGEDAHARTAALEAELQNERAQFRLAERAARVGYWRLRLSDDHLTWSPGMYRILGIDSNAAPDAQWMLDQIHPDDMRGMKGTIEAAIRMQLPFYYRCRARRPGTMAQIVDTYGEVEIAPAGYPVSVIGLCYDVTQQVKAQNQSARTEERYRLMMEEASDIIMLHGQQGRVEFASGALERILGRTMCQFDANGYLDIVHPDDLIEAEKLAMRPPRGKSYTATYRARHTAGHYVWLEATTRSVFDENTGEFRHIVSVTRDVSERKAQELVTEAAREEAVAANQAKSAFLANMSHELRTPLNAIIGFANIMRDEMFGPIPNARYREYVSLIQSSGQLLLDLIGDVLDMAKIEAGKFQLLCEEMDLVETVKECVQMLADRAMRGGVRIIATASAPDIVCWADQRAMKQIVLNLLSNAVKFTCPGGRVEIEVRARDDSVHIEVRDDGIGIASEDLPRLANPFEQACIDPKLAKSGTGLGLALVRALAERHGGTLRIDSPQRKGTIATVEFPRFPAERIRAA